MYKRQVYGGFTIAKMNLVQLDTILHIPTAVSYTHLDVYKRQTLYIILKIAKDGRFASGYRIT